MRTIGRLMMMIAMLWTFNSLLSAQTPIPAEERERMLIPYHEAPEGMVRRVLFLDRYADESVLKLELIPGKIMNVDCNIHILSGRIRERIIDGWGYPYYQFTTNGAVRSTQMACDQPNEDRFVQAESLLVRYNSRLPVVVYLPQGFDVLYRIWEAGEMQSFP